MDAFVAMHDIESHFNLQYSGQDWGIMNASSRRAEAFLDFWLAEFARMLPEVRFNMAELILASFNDLLLEGPFSSDLEANLLRFIKQCLESEALMLHVRYWRDLDRPEEFPLGAWLREYIMIS